MIIEGLSSWLSKIKMSKLTLILVLVALWILSIVGAVRLFGKQLHSLSSQNKVVETQKILEEESVVIDVVEKVSPSVVSIAVEGVAVFDPFGLGQSQSGKKEQSGIGTGFVVSRDGLIVTNKHVVSEERKYIAIIRANDGTERKFEIKRVNRDPFNDLALVQVEAVDLVPVELGDSGQLKVGQKVIAIGNALGRFENTVTTGVVSGLGRGVTPFDPSTGLTERLEDLVQTDAAINPGNSGGPLVNSAGQVIGINTAVASAENIGFAIKINIVKQLIADFASSGGKIARPFLGVRYSHISRETALLNNVPEGELVRQVVEGSAASSAGIEIGDIISQFDGQKLTEEETLSKIIRTKKVGDQVKIRVFRDGNTLDLTATLGEASGE